MSLDKGESVPERVIIGLTLLTRSLTEDFEIVDQNLARVLRWLTEVNYVFQKQR